MRILRNTLFTLCVMLGATCATHAQTVVVSGHVKLPDSNSPSRPNVCLSLQAFKPNLPKAVATGVILNATNFCITPAADGSYSTTLYPNTAISPNGTYWRVDFNQNGAQQSSASYVITGATNLDTAIPIVTPPPSTMLVFGAKTFVFSQLSAATTWVINHGFGDKNVIAQCTDASGQVLYPDTVVLTDNNNATVTFITPQSGSCIVMSAGTATFTTLISTPSNIVGSATLAKLDGVIMLDALAYPTLASAIAACFGSTACVVDARNPAIGPQIFTGDPFNNLDMPVTLSTGPYTISWDHATTYVSLPSHSHWTFNGTTLRNSTGSVGPAISPVTPTVFDYGGFVTTKVYQTTGTVTASSTAVTVADASRLQVGGVLTLVGGAGSTAAQATTTSGSTGTGTSFTVASTAGWDVTGVGKINYLQVENELMSCLAGTATTFTSCTRGVFGTANVSHGNAIAVQAVPALVSEIASIVGNVVTLNTASSLTLTNAIAYGGVTDVTLDGDGIFDGNQTVASATTRLIGLLIEYATGVTVSPGIKFRNFDHGGVLLTASMHNLVSPTGFEGIGKPSTGGGADIWLFEKANANTVRTGSHVNGSYGLIIDDRSGNFTINSGNSNSNTASLGSIGNYNTCVDVEGGSSQNTVGFSRCKATVTGLQITATSQWIVAPTPSNNTVTFGSIDATAGAAFADSLYTGGNNYISGGNVLGGTVTLATGDTLITGSFAGVRVTHLGQNAATGDVAGLKTLAGGVGTVTFIQPYNSTPVCIAQDQTTIANTVTCTPSTTSLTFAGTGTDVVKYIVIGNPI